MKFLTYASVLSLAATSVFSAAVVEKRDQKQNVLAEKIWTSTSNGVGILVTPTAIDGVTVSASPITSSATPWVSLDGSGIPHAVTPTVSDGTTISASPVPTQDDYPETTGGAAPVLRCTSDRLDSSDTDNPFCILKDAELVTGETYWITWDPTYWGGNVERVRIQTKAYPLQDDDNALFTSDYVLNNNGYYAWYIKSTYKQPGTEGYFWLNIMPLVTSDTTATHVGLANGPLLRIIDRVSDAKTDIKRLPSDNVSTQSSSSNNKAKVIVPAVVVPVVVVAAIIFGVFFYFNKHRKNNENKGFFSNIKLGNSGYFGRSNNNSQAANVAATAGDNESITTNDLRSEYDARSLRTASTGQSANPFR
ncbi:hypothetical protein B5S31_g2327 [[Candida] boidinii]|nr:hypothetical protein B5S31_g2327 [[Candida] boidinii]